MAHVSVTTQKRINLGQLGTELGTDQVFGPSLDDLASTRSKEISAEGVTEQALTDAVASHTYDADWQPAGQMNDWRTALQNELDFITSQLGTWPANATTNAEALQRVNFLLAATKRLARNQQRILTFIRDQVMDAEA